MAIISLSLSGHRDSPAILTLALVLHAIIARKPLMSNLLLALSFISKFFGISLLPLFRKRARWPYMARAIWPVSAPRGRLALDMPSRPVNSVRLSKLKTLS